MAKKKIKVTRQEFKEIKKPSQKIEEKAKEEIKEKGEASEPNGSDEDEQEEGGGQEFGFDDFSSIERAAPVLKPTGGEDQGEALESMLDVFGRKEEKGDENPAHDSGKPKYSFSAVSDEDDEAIQELRHLVLKETPRLIERTHEARELDFSRIQDSMLANLGVEEYAVKYVPQHKEEFLHEHEEIRDRKIDIKKYKKER